MNTRQTCSLLLGSALLLAGRLAAAETEYENHIDVSAGFSPADGDRPGFQKARQRNRQGYGGIEDLYLTRAINDTTNLTIKGRALAGNNDYLFDLTLSKDDVGYVKAGYREYRVWYDGTGGYYPPTNFHLSIYDEDLHTDRGNLWFEAGYTAPDKPSFVLRYDMFTRKGEKDSTSWGDTNLTGGTRAIIPSFWLLDEKRHIVTGTLSGNRSEDRWELGLRYDKGDYTDSRNIRRRATESVDRYVTEKEGRDYDLFMVRGSYVAKIHDKLTVTTAVARTKIDSTISGSRIYGPDYDPVYDANFVNRQARDEGFFDLSGDTELKQTVGTISALYQPTENLSVVPAFRAEKIDTVNVAEFVETNFTSARVADNEELESSADKSWKNISETFELRYKGIKNVALNFKAEWVQATGNLTEEEIAEPNTPSAATTIDRDTDFDRNSQKYSATANWYLLPGTSVTVQAYYKVRENDYHSPRDSTVSTGDRYPAYIANQDFETTDFNARFSTRINSKMRSVTRYDYQESTIRSQEIDLQMGDSATMKSHIIAETLSWNPLSRWYLQGTVNYVLDMLTTPATTVTGAALNQVKNSDANYTNFTFGTGYALDQGSDLYVDYSLYRAWDDFIDNSAYSLPYGTKARTQQAGLTWFKQLDRRTALTFRYAYAKNVDDAWGGLADYEAHIFYGKVQYKF